MRLYGISVEEVEAVIAGPAAREVDGRGVAAAPVDPAADRQHAATLQRIERLDAAMPPGVR